MSEHQARNLAQGLTIVDVISIGVGSAIYLSVAWTFNRRGSDEFYAVVSSLLHAEPHREHVASGKQEGTS